jgi:ribosomal subunit interface protein
MKLPVQITFRDLVPLPSLEPEIRRRVDQLDQWSTDLMSCHVVVEAEANRHQQGHLYRVLVSLRLPDGELVSGSHRGHEDIHAALSDSFDALDRQVEDHARRRRGQVKHHAEPLRDRTDSGSGPESPD